MLDGWQLNEPEQKASSATQAWAAAKFYSKWLLLVAKSSQNLKPAGKAPAPQLSKTTILNSISPQQNVTMDKLQLKTYVLSSSDTVLSQCNTFVSKDTWHLTRGEAASSASVPVTQQHGYLWGSCFWSLAVHHHRNISGVDCILGFQVK